MAHLVWFFSQSSVWTFVSSAIAVFPVFFGVLRSSKVVSRAPVWEWQLNGADLFHAPTHMLCTIVVGQVMLSPCACADVRRWNLGKAWKARHGSAHTRGLHSSPPLEEEEPEFHSLLLAYIACLCFPCRPVGCCSHSARNATASTHWSPTRTCKSIPFCHQSWSHLRTLSVLTCPDTQHFFFCVWKPSHPIPNQKTLSRNQCGRTTQAQGKDSRDRDRKHREETPAGIATANTKLQQKWLEPKCLIQLPCVWKNSPILSPGAVGTSETRLTWRNQKTTDVAKEAAAKRTQEPHADVRRDSPLFSLPHSNLSITSPVRQSLPCCWPTIAFSLGFQRRLPPLTCGPTCSLRQMSTVSFFSVRASLRQHEFTCFAYSSAATSQSLTLWPMCFQ